MITAALVCAIFAAPVLDVSLAPDQPVPYVYAGEPLILRIQASEDCETSGEISISDSDGKSIAISLPTTPVHAKNPYFKQLDGTPAAKGRFTVHVALTTAGTQMEKDLVYCRIERPSETLKAPVRVRIGTQDPSLLHALRGIPLRKITVPIATPGLASFVKSASDNGFRPTIALDKASTGDLGSLAQHAAELGETVAAWRVPVPDVPVEAIDPIAAALRDAGSRAPVEIQLAEEAGDIDSYLAAGLARSAVKIFAPVTARALSSIRGIHESFEKAGYEGYQLQAFVESPGADDTNPWRIAEDILVLQYVEGAVPEIDASVLYDGSKFGESYPLVCAMAHRLNGYTYLAELPMQNRAKALVFREGDAWITAVWATGQPTIQMLPIGVATAIDITDANNNTLSLPKVEAGALRLALTSAPVYVSGKGGPLPAAAARAAARSEADAFVKNKSFQKDLPPEVIQLIAPIAAPNFMRADRVSFFALLRLFPVIEQKWHDGTMDRGVAVPAMASLSRLASSLCVIEQDSGEPFIELLQDTIARCGEYQSKYLTSTSGSVEKHERADWLLGEVARLTARAKAMADCGRPIEAVGIASIAEWRARSLEFAMNAAPLGVPEPERATPASPQPAKQGAASTPSKKKGASKSSKKK